MAGTAREVRGGCLPRARRVHLQHPRQLRFASAVCPPARCGARDARGRASHHVPFLARGGEARGVAPLDRGRGAHFGCVSGGWRASHGSTARGSDVGPLRANLRRPEMHEVLVKGLGWRANTSNFDTGSQAVRGGPGGGLPFSTMPTTDAATERPPRGTPSPPAVRRALRCQCS